MATALDQMIALLELLPPEAAGHHRSAVAIHAIGEVLTGEANTRALPALQLALVNEIPFLHAQPTRPGNSTPVLLPRRALTQHVQRSLMDLFKGIGNAPGKSRPRPTGSSNARLVPLRAELGSS